MDGTEVVVGSMDAILASAGSMVTEALSWVGEVVTTITGNPLLLMFVVLPLIGLGVGLVKRIIN